MMLERANGPTCPRCGCQDCRILRHPTPGRWFGSGHGRAQCGACGAAFTIQRIEIEMESPPVDIQEPVIDGEREERPKPVRYQILCCPECGSEKTRVTKTERPVRHHKCKECGATFKTTEERQRPVSRK